MEKKIKTFGKIAVPVAGVLGILGVLHIIHTPDRNIIGLIPQYESVEFKGIQAGLEEETKKMGYELLVKVTEEMTVQAQRKMMNELVKEGADCILIEAVAEGGFQDVLDECHSQEIPVIAYNSRVNSQDIYAEVLPYSIESAAEAILTSMEEHTDASGQFGILSSTNQDYLREARTREIISRLEVGTCPQLHFTGSGFTKEKEELVLEKSGQLEKKYPDLEFMVCYSTLDAINAAKYMKESGADWKMICEASLDEFDSVAPEGTVVLTYDYARYGHFLTQLAISAMQEKEAPESGKVFEWEDDRTYLFQKRWGPDSSEKNSTSADIQFCSITMQDKPDVMVREENEWK